MTDAPYPPFCSPVGFVGVTARAAPDREDLRGNGFWRAAAGRTLRFGLEVAMVREQPGRWLRPAGPPPVSSVTM